MIERKRLDVPTFAVVIEPAAQPMVYNWSVAGPPACSGSSREPLLDACRALKLTGARGTAFVTMSRRGRETWDLRTRVDAGAALTVGDARFGKYAAERREKRNQSLRDRRAQAKGNRP